MSFNLIFFSLLDCKDILWTKIYDRLFIRNINKIIIRALIIFLSLRMISWPTKHISFPQKYLTQFLISILPLSLRTVIKVTSNLKKCYFQSRSFSPLNIIILAWRESAFQKGKIIDSFKIRFSFELDNIDFKIFIGSILSGKNIVWMNAVLHNNM